MTILQLADVSPYTKNYTLGSSGAWIGYALDPGGLGTFGSVIPVNEFRAKAVRQLVSGSAVDFVLMLDGTTPQSYFTSIVARDQLGNERLFLSSAASYSQTTHAIWSWGNGSNRVWTDALFSPNRNVLFF